MDRSYRKIVVAGAGTMGVTLARIFARNGYETVLWNRRQVSLDRGEQRIREELTALREQSRLAEEPEAILSRLSFTTDWSAFADADFVIENIAEDLEIKRDFYRRLCTVVPEETLLTTNTSGLRVSDIAQAVTRPERFCGMHWWNPPDLIPLVEVTRGDLTGEETARQVYDLALSLEKKPILVKKDILGIIGNRLQYAVLREALHILSLGAADPEAVDAAMKYGPGFRYSILGPLETADLGGLDIVASVSSYLFAELGSEADSPLLKELAGQGKLGTKTGEGFYSYQAGIGAEKIRWRNDLLQKQWDLIQENEFQG